MNHMAHVIAKLFNLVSIQVILTLTSFFIILQTWKNKISANQKTDKTRKAIWQIKSKYGGLKITSYRR